MNKKTKSLIYFLIFILVNNCSFDNKTGIWSGGKDEKDRIAKLEKEQQSKIEVIKVYSTENIYANELPYDKNINLSNPKKNSSWETSNLNLQNYIGNLYLSGIGNNFLKKRIGKNKYEMFKVVSSPLVLNENIIFADDTGSIFSVNQRGKVVWKKNIYKKLYKKIYKNLSLSIYKNKIYVADNVGFIYSINSENGKLAWVKNHGIPLRSHIKVFDNKIFLINQDNRIICLDSSNGSKIWDIRAISSFIKTQNFLSLAVSKKGEVVVLSSSGDLLKINSKTGQIYWSNNVTSAMSASETDFFKSSEIVIYKNEIFFSAVSSIYSVNLTNGFINWEKAVSTKNTPIIDKNNVFLVSDDGYFVNLNKNSGDTVWSTNILKILKKKHQKTKIAGFILGSGKIYALTSNGYIIVCSANSGEVESFIKIGSTVSAAPIISSGSLYILTEKPMILGFN